MQTIPLVIGTYTKGDSLEAGKADGILGYDLGAEATTPTVLARCTHPSYLALTRGGTRLYAVHEMAEFEGKKGGGVTAFARDNESGELTELNARSSEGQGPCHIAIDPTGRFAVVVHYGSGSITTFGINDDGSLSEARYLIQHQGSSVHPNQGGPHAHMAMFDPVTSDVLVTDLGADAVVTYRLSETGELIERPEARISTAPGAGPRHMAFHPGHDVLFLVNELDNTVTALRRDGERFSATATVSSLPDGFEGHSQAAAVRVSPSGRHVFASNRGVVASDRAEGSDSIAMLRFDESAGSLELVHVEPTQGHDPRDFVVTPDGSRLIAANQNSDSVVLFEIDEDAAGLRPILSAYVPTPVCLLLV